MHFCPLQILPTNKGSFLFLRDCALQSSGQTITDVTRLSQYQNLNESARNLTISDFRPAYKEEETVRIFLKQVTSYFLIKDIVRGDFVALQTFFAVSINTSKPEGGNVKYIQVLDEVEDGKDTILHVISDFYLQSWQPILVLEGDSKTCDLGLILIGLYHILVTGIC